MTRLQLKLYRLLGIESLAHMRARINKRIRQENGMEIKSNWIYEGMRNG